MLKFSVPFKITAPNAITATFDAALEKIQKQKNNLHLSHQVLTDLKTAFVEGIANAIRHGKELAQKKTVCGRFILDQKNIGFEILDHGSGFNLNALAVPNFTKMSTSGRGVFMMRQLGDELKYTRGKKENKLVFKRHLIGGKDDTVEIDLLYNISEAILSGAALEKVYQIILDQALDVFHVERASILIYDETLKRLRVVASRGLSQDMTEKIAVRSGDGVSGYVFQHGRPLLIEDITRNKRGLEKKQRYKSTSFISAPMICSPLRLDEKPLGVINLTDRKDGKKFTRKDLKLLSTIANQAMACVHIRELVDKVRKMEHVRQEMATLHRIQNSYLPAKAPHLNHWDIAGRCEMAQSVGGDYFDFFVNHGHLYVVIADVSGHDISSAMTMVNFRAQLKAFLSEAAAPNIILNKINATLYDDLQRSEQFISCILVKIHTQSGDFEIANAGHPPPLSLKGSPVATDSGLVLGIQKQEVYTTTHGKFDKGDGLLLFTDGVIEAKNEKNQNYGLEKLRRELISCELRSSAEIVEKILHSVITYRTHLNILDDAAMVAIQYLG
jgi:sigma-B regulation protein RsbU (phosphoserine phosphatase)